MPEINEGATGELNWGPEGAAGAAGELNLGPEGAAGEPNCRPGDLQGPE